MRRFRALHSVILFGYYTHGNNFTEYFIIIFCVFHNYKNHSEYFGCQKLLRACHRPKDIHIGFYAYHIAHCAAHCLFVLPPPLPSAENLLQIDFFFSLMKCSSEKWRFASISFNPPYALSMKMSEKRATGCNPYSRVISCEPDLIFN